MTTIALNKPYRVMTQFSPCDAKLTLASLVTQPDLYPAGRLDYESEGLLLLTSNGALQGQITHPRFKLPKSYLVQVEGLITATAIQQLSGGVQLKDGMTRPAQVEEVEQPDWLWPRTPPVRYRAAIPTSWMAITIREGRNRQVRRMTAAVGLPTLRLIRTTIGPIGIDGLAPGEWRLIDEAILQRTFPSPREVKSPRRSPYPPRSKPNSKGP